MPFRIKKVKTGYKVENALTGKTYSKKPLTKPTALKQLGAISVSYYKK